MHRNVVVRVSLIVAESGLMVSRQVHHFHKICMTDLLAGYEES